jgi:hypothetical protein
VQLRTRSDFLSVIDKSLGSGGAFFGDGRVVIAKRSGSGQKRGASRAGRSGNG